MSNKPVIAFVLPNLIAGGAERVLITLMNGLDRNKFRAEFIMMDDLGPLRPWIAEHIPVHSLQDKKINVKGILALAKKLNEIQPDIIISTMSLTNFAVLLTKPLLKFQTKIIAREAVIPSSIIDNHSYPFAVKTAYKALYPRADAVLAPAQCIIDEFKNKLRMTKNRYVLLHNPVDIERIRKAAATVPATDAQTVRFIAAGRMHPQKGFDRLVEVLPKFNKKNWRLDILGTGPERDSLIKRVAELSLQDKVFLPGLEKNPWPLIAAADAFVLPSRWEGLPNVVLESLSVGTPVIATKESGGIDEIAALAPNAVTIVNDMDGFIAAMENVQVSSQRGTLRASLLPEHFHLETVNQAFEKILQTL